MQSDWCSSCCVVLELQGSLLTQAACPAEIQLQFTASVILTHVQLCHRPSVVLTHGCAAEIQLQANNKTNFAAWLARWAYPWRESNSPSPFF